MSCPSDITILINIFNENCLAKTFDIILSEFNTLSKKTYFHSGSAIVLMLRNKEIINNQPHYLIAYFLLWELGKSESEPNPFLDVIYTALAGKEFNTYGLPVLDNVGRTFLWSIIQNNPKDMLRLTPYQVYQEGLTNDIDLSPLSKQIQDNYNDLPQYSKFGLSCIVPFEDVTLYKTDVGEKEDTKSILESLLLGDAPSKRSLRPEFIRPTPPLHCSGIIDELIWIDPPHFDHTFICDADIPKDINNEEYILNLMKTAKTVSLSQNQLNQLQQKLKESPDILKKIDFKPNELPGLVEKNPSIAFEVLLIAYETPELVASYLNELLRMDISLHTLEVVNQLTSAVEVPAQFIHQYIDRCTQSCQTSNDKVSHRLVRLVCVFLQSLIRNKIIEIKDTQSLLTSFCLDHSAIKEATALFKLIKTVSGNNENE